MNDDTSELMLIHSLLADINDLDPGSAKINRYTFVGDSAVSGHMGFCEEGVYDIIPCNEAIRVGDNKVVHATKKGKNRVKFF